MEKQPVLLERLVTKLSLRLKTKSQKSLFLFKNKSFYPKFSIFIFFALNDCFQYLE